MEFLQGLLTRRSVAPKDMQDVGPTQDEITQILNAALRVPDHGKLGPWRIITFDKTQQVRFGEVVQARFKAITPDATEAQIAFERARPSRAPLMIAVLSTPKEGKIPQWEQELSVGAVCQNMLNACYALGYGAKWLTEWIAFDVEILRALGGSEKDRVAGFIYIGKSSAVPEERQRPMIAEVVSAYGG